MTAPVREIGYQQAMAGMHWWRWQDETTIELQWPQSSYVYDQMRKQDSQVKSVLQAVSLPIRSTPWRIDPAGARARVVQLVAEDLGLPIAGKDPRPMPRTRDRFSWRDHLREAMLMLVFGHSYFEQVYRIDEAGRARLRKLALRPAKTIEAIDVASDGGLKSIKQYAMAGQSTPAVIPVDRLVAYINEREGGNWLGLSLLRSCYKNWLIKDRLLRVQAQTIERNGMGIPLYKAQENASEADITAGAAMAQSWRAGEAAGSAVPYGADLLLRGVDGQLPDADKPIRYHDEQIGRSVLAHFLNLGTQTGSWALGTTFADFFTMSLQSLAQQIAEVVTQHVIEDLVDANFGPSEPAPCLIFDEIGSRQPATAEGLKALVDAGIVHPDMTLEQSVRQQYGQPPKDSTPNLPPPGSDAPPDVRGPGDRPLSGPVPSTSQPSLPGMDTPPPQVKAAAGMDTHPGGEQLKHYWVYGEGAAKWSTWTELRDHLLKFLNPEMAKRTAAEWFHERYKFWPGADANRVKHGKAPRGQRVGPG